MNIEELLAAAKEIGARKIAREDFLNSDLDVTLVHEEGGYEGAGEYAERVFEHNNNGELLYFKITGYYSSYDGTEWDNTIKQVKPEQKTITVYNNV